MRIQMKMQKIIANEYIYGALTRVLLLATGMLYNIFLARYLGAELKGSFAYIQSLSSTGSIALMFGIHQAYPHYRKRYGKENYISKYMTCVITLFIFYSIISFLLSMFLLKRIEFIAAAMLMPVMGYAHISGYVYLIERPNRRNTILLLSGIAEVLCLLLITLLATRNLLLVLAMIALIEILKAVIFTGRIHFKLEFGLYMISTIRDLLKYGFFPMVALLMTTFNYKLDVLMLRQYSNITLADIGVYSVGASIAEKSLLVSDSAREILLSKLAKGKDAEETAKVTRICFLFGILATIAVIILGYPFIRYFFDAEFHGAYNIIVINVFGTIMMVFFKMVSTYNVVNSKQKINVFLLSISIVINVIINLVLIPKWGINGAGIATVIGHIVCGFMFILYFSRITNIPFKKIMMLQKEDLHCDLFVLNKRNQENAKS